MLTKTKKIKIGLEKNHSVKLRDFSVNSVLKFASTKIYHRVHGEVTETHGEKFSILFCLLCAALFFNFACTPRAFEKPNAAAPTANENKLSDFENDLLTMRTAGFEYIFVFRRKDGGEFDSDDRKFLRANSPAETNRFVATDNGRAFVAGSKYVFPPPNIEALRTRFDTEDYSPPKEVK